MHERQAIRDAAVALLTGETAAGARVYKTRIEPVLGADLPAISVYTDSETVAPSSGLTAPQELTRTVELAVEGWVTAATTDALDDALDDLCLEIETAMDQDLNLDETAYSSLLASTESAWKLDGRVPIGAVRMVWTVVYHTDLRVAAPEDDLSTLDIHYDLNNEQDTEDQANDSIEDLEV